MARRVRINIQSVPMRHGPAGRPTYTVAENVLPQYAESIAHHLTHTYADARDPRVFHVVAEVGEEIHNAETRSPPKD